MKKLLFSVVALTLMATSASAQEKVIEKAKFSDNWFIQAQGGASYTFSEYYRDGSFGKLITPQVALSFGKHFTPVFGLRAQVAGWESKSKYPAKDDYYKHKYIQGSLDGMWNLTNIFGEYNPNRAVDFYGFVGLAFVHGKSNNSVNINEGRDPQEFDKKGVNKSNMVLPRLGFQLDYHVSNVVSLNLEANGTLLEDRFNGIVQDRSYDGMVNVLAGVTFHINRGFKQSDVYSQSEIDKLNSQINEHRAALADRDNAIAGLKDELAKKPKVVIEEKAVEETIEEVLMNAVVVFKLGKSELQDNQEINIFNAAKFFQDNLDYRCVITGYADKATGSAKVNQRISEQRAEAVKKVMVEKFGISADRITTQASGDKVQPFQNDAWNRVVIFTAVKNK